MSTRKNLDERIAAAKEEAEKKQARLKLLMQQQKKEERKARNHRLCERGGKVESLLPSLAKLTDEQFHIFVEKTLLTPHTKRILDELLPNDTTADQSGGDAEPLSAETAKTAQPSVSKGNGKTGDAARVAS